MDATSLEKIAEWAGGTLTSGDPQRTVTEICTDSRKLQPGNLFLALRGEKFDAHTFIEEAAKLGAAGAVVEEAPSGLPPEFAVILVGNTLAAVQSIAGNYRRSLPLRVIAITGSNGKTSTKDFTAAVLSERFRVTRTEGNFNNHIGLPLTMLRASKRDEIGVFEIGMNHPGEIAPLARLAQPDVGIITNIGMAHLEFMKTRDAIALEKGMLAEAVAEEGHVVLAAEDDYAGAIAARTLAHVVRAGLESGDVRATDLRTEADGTSFTLRAGGAQCQARLGVPGAHMVRNALLAVAAGLIFGLSAEQCAHGLRLVKLTSGRLEQKTIRGIRVLDDSYNANPDSVIAALRTLAQLPAEGRRIAVLGQMNELGEASEWGHARVGEAAGREHIDFVLTVGERAAAIGRSAHQHGVPEVFELGSTEEATRVLRDLAQPGDLVLVKGSRSAGMERIVEGLAV
jgi:UDP-N-acetylmuramoyl-tripeptide--D-alanyl-D-alanine ligase